MKKIVVLLVTLLSLIGVSSAYATTEDIVESDLAQTMTSTGNVYLGKAVIYNNAVSYCVAYSGGFNCKIGGADYLDGTTGNTWYYPRCVRHSGVLSDPFTVNANGHDATIQDMFDPAYNGSNAWYCTVTWSGNVTH